ncbi:hypothetical protein [Actinoplanes xinjiangensis]|uniref:hypothetical protein n=1 Tax=Actinoplanes xinjiangensis TaxID=512350 RepID=UPI000D6B8CB6|nr:hypothetical protein [Actinoplanes xinjiangensis]GIF41649.1 hypothetical protein Axi01nite_59600 [Actinoplanes xinjiangensis]
MPFVLFPLTVATPVAAVWLIPDQTNEAARKLAADGVELDYGIEPVSFGPVADTVIGVVACAVVVICLALLASGTARRTIASAWWGVALSILAVGFFGGFCWRVWTAGGIGANIGAGFMVLMSPFCIGLGLLPGIVGAVFIRRARNQRLSSAAAPETAP